MNQLFPIRWKRYFLLLAFRQTRIRVTPPDTSASHRTEKHTQPQDWHEYAACNTQKLRVAFISLFPFPGITRRIWYFFNTISQCR